MPLTKADIQDTTLLLKAGNINAARRILSGSNDPDAIELLAKFDARYPVEAPPTPRPALDLAEVKRLIGQKKFDAAETLLRASDDPNANRLLQKIALLKSTDRSKLTEKMNPRPRRPSLWKYIAVKVWGFISSSN